MLFRTRLWTLPLIMLTIMTLSVAVVWITLGLILDYWPTPDWDDLYFLGMPALATLGGGMRTVSLWRRHPAWVRVSDAGVELAAGGAPIFIAWANVATAAVHRPGLFAVLDIIPVNAAQVTTTGPYATVPPIRRLSDGAGFRVQVGHLLPGPRALRRAFSRYRAQMQ
jgi:hypothetical protein